jgi:hypothetical protein
MKQTAVEWLFDKMLTEKHTISEWNDIREEAKEMEKQQIIDAYLSDRFPCSDEDAEQYYNETFKKD